MTGDTADRPEPGHTARESSLARPVETGIDDRRVQARAHGRWVSMLHGRACPSLEDLEAAGVAGPCDVLIDLRRDADDPEFTCIGAALVADCGRRGLRRLSQVPAGSYLALLTAPYRRAAATRLPVAFDGRRSQTGGYARYRAILMPLSSDGHTVDFVHGTMCWREPAEPRLAAGIAGELKRSPGPPPGANVVPLWPCAGARPGRRLLGA